MSGGIHCFVDVPCDDVHPSTCLACQAGGPVRIATDVYPERASEHCWWCGNRLTANNAELMLTIALVGDGGLLGGLCDACCEAFAFEMFDELREQARVAQGVPGVFEALLRELGVL